MGSMHGLSSAFPGPIPLYQSSLVSVLQTLNVIVLDFCGPWGAAHQTILMFYIMEIASQNHALTWLLELIAWGHDKREDPSQWKEKRVLTFNCWEIVNTSFDVLMLYWLLNWHKNQSYKLSSKTHICAGMKGFFLQGWHCSCQVNLNAWVLRSWWSIYHLPNLKSSKITPGRGGDYSSASFHPCQERDKWSKLCIVWLTQCWVKNNVYRNPLKCWLKFS